MPIRPTDPHSKSTPKSTVEPAVEPTAYERRVAALSTHRPGSLPPQFMGKVLKPNERVKAQADIVYGQTAADALDALIRPNSKMDRGVARRAIEMLFPKDRPVALALPDANSPEAFNRAMKLIHEAWTSGRISPSEAESCQRLVNARYRGWIKAQAGKPR
jgi:hypothetical protein